jgi:hypothetical protein
VPGTLWREGQTRVTRRRQVYDKDIMRMKGQTSITEKRYGIKEEEATVIWRGRHWDGGRMRGNLRSEEKWVQMSEGKGDLAHHLKNRILCTVALTRNHTSSPNQASG